MKVSHRNMKFLAQRYASGNRGKRKAWIRRNRDLFAVAMDAAEAGRKALAIEVLLDAVHLRDAYWVATDGGITTDATTVEGRPWSVSYDAVLRDYYTSEMMVEASTRSHPLLSMIQRETESAIGAMADRIAQIQFRAPRPQTLVMSPENYEALRVQLGSSNMHVIADPNVPRGVTYVMPNSTPHRWWADDGDRTLYSGVQFGPIVIDGGDE